MLGRCRHSSLLIRAAGPATSHRRQAQPRSHHRSDMEQLACSAASSAGRQDRARRRSRQTGRTDGHSETTSILRSVFAPRDRAIRSRRRSKRRCDRLARTLERRRSRLVHRERSTLMLCREIKRRKDRTGSPSSIRSCLARSMSSSCTRCSMTGAYAETGSTSRTQRGLLRQILAQRQDAGDGLQQEHDAVRHQDRRQAMRAGRRIAEQQERQLHPQRCVLARWEADRHGLGRSHHPDLGNGIQYGDEAVDAAE